MQVRRPKCKKWPLNTSLLICQRTCTVLCFTRQTPKTLHTTNAQQVATDSDNWLLPVCQVASWFYRSGIISLQTSKTFTEEICIIDTIVAQTNYIKKLKGFSNLGFSFFCPVTWIEWGFDQCGDISLWCHLVLYRYAKHDLPFKGGTAFSAKYVWKE